MAGQAGFEPATTGFGVRRSSQLELLTQSPSDFDLTMKGVSPASRTKLLQRKLLGGSLPVFGRRVVLPLTLITRKAYDFTHNRSLLSRSY
jgi:hypothetical protein